MKLTSEQIQHLTAVLEQANLTEIEIEELIQELQQRLNPNSERSQAV